MATSRGSEHLSSDVLLCVFSFLSLPHRIHGASIVSKRWCRLARQSVTELPPLENTEISLALRTCTSVTSLPDLPSDISLIPTCLATLTVLPRDYDNAAIARICAMCTCLTRLTMKTRRAPEDPLWAPLLRACAVHLESLSLQRTIPIGPIILPLDTTSLALPRLRSLTFSGKPYDWMTEFAQPWFAPIWTQLTHFSCDKVFELPRPEDWRIPPSHSLRELSLSATLVPDLLPLAPRATVLCTAITLDTDHVLYSALSSATSDPSSIALHLVDHIATGSDLGMFASYLVALDAPSIAEGFCNHIYPRLTHLRLQSPTYALPHSFGTSAPALTHLALTLRDKFDQSLPQLQRLLPTLKRLKCLTLDVLALAATQRDLLRDFVVCALSHLGEEGGLRLALKVYPRTLEAHFLLEPALVPYVLR